MRKGQIAKATDAQLKDRYYALDQGASEEFEGEMTRIEREQDDREFERRHAPCDTPSLGDPWWAHP